MNIQVGAGAAYVLYLVIAYASARMMGLTGEKFYIFMCILSAMGLGAGVLFLWLWNKMKSGGSKGAAADGSAPADLGGADEVDMLIRDAESRLSASKLAGGAGIGNLPLIFIIGQQGSVKTNTILNSGMEPELLAGQIYQENNVVAPTRAANLWFARNAVFAEAGPGLLDSPPRWVKMIRRLRPGNLKSVVGGKEQAPRGAILCFDSETFLRPGNTDQLATMARNLQARLGEISQTLGISLPVYVLFTRSDRIPFFADYVRTLSNEEAAQVLGITLPIRSGQSAGVYAEEETRRLNAAFNALFHALCDRRVEFLARESDADKLPGAYEFPREFRKLRSPLVQFLVDVCRPSQLRASPFLRGFYFSGVRPVVVNESVAPMPRVADKSYEQAAGATSIFRTPFSQMAPEASGPAPIAGTKKVPQWLFLPHLFHHVILKDRAAMGASGSSTRTSTLQRVLLASAAVFFLIWCIGFTVSYFNNRSMINEAVTAAQGISGTEPSIGNLTKLDTLRQTLERLSGYERDGAPLSYRWFLFAGPTLYPEVRRAYYSRFSQIMFAQTQEGLRGTLDKVRTSPPPPEQCAYVYDTVKGYLITTAFHDKSTKAFLAPLLLSRWSAGRGVDGEQTRLAKNQFEFYSQDLIASNPYSSDNDSNAIDAAQSYIANSCGFESIYRLMLAAASKNNPSVNYSKKFPEADPVVVNRLDVAGAFTKGGWAFMQGAMKKPEQYMGNEEWVLGKHKSSVTDPLKLQQDLQNRYSGDFIAQWRAYIKGSVVRPYDNLADAANKLNAQSGNKSPILELFWLASQNTAVDSQKVTDAFQPVYKVVPAGSGDMFVGPSNQPYMTSLSALQVSIDQLAHAPGNPDASAASATLSNATMARSAVKNIAQNFRPDQEGRVDSMTQKLLEDPITDAERLLRGLGPKELNGKGAAFCAAFNVYPFNPGARREATAQDVVQLLKPNEGLLWSFYDQNLKNILMRQGNTFIPNPSGGVAVTPGFVSFMNTAAKLSDAFFKGGGPEPHIAYTITPMKAEGVQNLTMAIGGTTWNIPTQGAPAKQFFAPAAPGASLTATVGGSQAGGPTEGIWAAFRLFDGADHFTPSGTGYRLEYILKSQAKLGNLGGTNQQGVPVDFQLDMGGLPAFFHNGPQGMHCVSQVAK
jgi:type VI secretion system protein ImpL